MGFRFRKSFKIAPGLKLNLGGKSAGFSVGGKYGGLSWNSRRGTQARATAYGTGVSYRKSIGGKGKKFSLKKFFFSLVAVVLLLLLLAELLGITAYQFGQWLGILSLVAVGLLVVALLYGVFRLARFLFSLAGEAQKPEEAEEEIPDLQANIELTWPEDEKPKAVQPRLSPKDFDEYAELELSCPESVFPRRPPVGAFLELKPDPEYPRDSKAIKATWAYEGEEKIAGYIKKSDADIRNIIREYWAAGAQVSAQVRYNYDALGIFIGMKK